MESVKDRVKQGAALLDKERPMWANQIDKTRLDIASVRWCVLGQLYGSFSLGATWLGLGCVALSYRGFQDEPGALSAWTDEINARLGNHTRCPIAEAIKDILKDSNTP